MGANWDNKTVFTGDNLDIMRGMNSASVDLIYLDPPFNSKANYAAPVSLENEQGKKLQVEAYFKDVWTLEDIDQAWVTDVLAPSYPRIFKAIEAAAHNSDKAYLIYMTPRLLEMHRLLKKTGSFYLHCDPTMSHYLKVVLDAIFGRQQFRNEIVWHYKSGGATKRHFAKKHDCIYFYSKSNHYFFNPQQEKSYNRNYKKYGFDGIDEYQDTLGWYTMVNMRDVWPINMVGRTSNERTGYPTQKPLALLERIIKASSHEGDIVFDPFCGCATTMVAAENLNRQWVGCDISAMARLLVEDRLSTIATTAKKSSQGETTAKLRIPINGSNTPPTRTDDGKGVEYPAVAPPPEEKPTPYREHKNRLYGEQDGVCKACCHRLSKRDLEVDHIVPKSKGGSDEYDNLQLLCRPCNSNKGSKTMDEWRGNKSLAEFQREKVFERLMGVCTW